MVENDLNKILFIYDYTTVHEFSNEKIRDMCLFIYYGNNKKYIDSFSASPHNHDFTEAAWTLSLKQLIDDGFDFGGKINQFYIWSDGGLKSKENIFFFVRIAITFRIDIYLNFFGPSHGHSEVDGHFGAGKRNLRFNSIGKPITSEQEIFTAFSKLPKTFIQKITITKNSFLVKTF